MMLFAPVTHLNWQGVIACGGRAEIPNTTLNPAIVTCQKCRGTLRFFMALTGMTREQADEATDRDGSVGKAVARYEAFSKVGQELAGRGWRASYGSTARVVQLGQTSSSLSMAYVDPEHGSFTTEYADNSAAVVSYPDVTELEDLITLLRELQRAIKQAEPL